MLARPIESAEQQEFQERSDPCNEIFKKIRDDTRFFSQNLTS